MISLVTEDHVTAMYDAITMMRLFSQRLSEGEIDDRVAGEMSWLLGSAKLRLDPVLGFLEGLQGHQERETRDPQDDVIEIGSQILALMQKFQRTRAEREARG